MESSRNQAEYAVDRDKEYGALRSRSILNELEDKKISRQTAMKRLERSGIYGLFKCAELSVQEAYDSTDLNESLNYLLMATDLFTYAKGESIIFNKGSVESLSSRAEVQLAYIPVHTLLFYEEFPSESLAQKVHIKTINTAYNLLRQKDNWQRESIEATGTLGEFGVLALLQRLAIYEIGTEIYFPSPSTFDQDNHNHRGYTVNSSWDINVYGDVGHGMKRVNRIQVKTRDPQRDGTPVVPVQHGIQLVCIEPHLKLEEDCHSVTREIIEDLVREQDFPKDSQEYIDASKRLDERTELLLSRLD